MDDNESNAISDLLVYLENVSPLKPFSVFIDVRSRETGNSLT
jgi:hypothetical protein